MAQFLQKQQGINWPLFSHMAYTHIFQGKSSLVKKGLRNLVAKKPILESTHSNNISLFMGLKLLLNEQLELKFLLESAILKNLPSLQPKVL